MAEGKGAMDNEQLVETLDRLEKAKSEDWLLSLEGRKKKELEFDNRNRDEAYEKGLDRTSHRKPTDTGSITRPPSSRERTWTSGSNLTRRQNCSRLCLR